MIKLKLVTGLCLLIFSMNLSAQENSDGENFTRKGRVLLGASTDGGLNFSKNSTELNGQTISESEGGGFNLRGSVGYFIIENLVGGVQLGFSSFLSESKTEENEFSSNTITLGPFVTYYFNVGNSNIRPYVNASTAFGSGKTESTYSYINGGDIDPTIQTDEFKQQRFEWTAGAGVAFFLNDTISINVEAGYRNRTTKDPDNEDRFESKFSNLGLNAGLSIFL